MAGFLRSCAFFTPTFIEVSTRDSKGSLVLADVTKGHCQTRPGYLPYAAHVVGILACASERIPNWSRAAVFPICITIPKARLTAPHADLNILAQDLSGPRQHWGQHAWAGNFALPDSGCGGRAVGIGVKNLYLCYKERRKFKMSCCCDGLSALKLLITPLASELHFEGWKRS